jgi:hypothetical protein
MDQGEKTPDMFIVLEGKAALYRTSQSKAMLASKFRAQSHVMQQEADAEFRRRLRQEALLPIKNNDMQSEAQEMDQMLLELQFYGNRTTVS